MFMQPKSYHRFFSIVGFALAVEDEDEEFALAVEDEDEEFALAAEDEDDEFAMAAEDEEEGRKSQRSVIYPEQTLKTQT